MEGDGAEYTGRTVEDAVAKAEAELGLSRDELQIQVISQGSRGVFGIGAEPARVRVERATVAAAAPPPSGLASAEATTSTPAGPASSGVAEVKPSRDGANLAGEAQEVVEDLLHSMGFEAEVSVRSQEEPVIVAINGENLGVLIGRRGDNLAALQFMVNLILSKNRRQWPRIVIDVENYRSRREESLRSLADRIAYRVRRNGRPFTLEAMPASDRRIIHLALRDRPDVETYSIGEGVARRVVVAPKRAITTGSPY